MSTQSFATTHQGMVLSVYRLGSSEGVNISTGLCRLSRSLPGGQTREEPGLPASAEQGAWLDLSMLELRMVFSGSWGVLSLIQLGTELVGLKEFRAFAEPCGECRDGQNSVCPLGIPNLLGGWPLSGVR